MSYLYFKFKLYPSEEQAIMLQKHCDCARFIYNKLLEENIKRHESGDKFLFGFSLSNEITKLRKAYAFLKEVNSQSLQQAAHNLGVAFKNRFKHKSGFPKFKSSRENRQSFSVPQSFSVKTNQIKLPKIGWIDMRHHRKFEGKIKSITIVKEVDMWYASILCELPNKEKPEINHNNKVGIDVGIKTFAITSDGDTFDLSKQERREYQLKILSRRLSKKQKGSKNKNKARLRLARKHQQIRRRKQKEIELFVSTITKRYDVVVLENLNIKGMKANKKLAPSIQKLPWYLLKTKLKEKAKKVHEISQWYPSSKTCSCCGWVNKDLKLSDRIYNCSACGISIDRDLNAAINIRNQYTDTTSGCACGDTNIGEVSSHTETRYVSMKQEYVSNERLISKV
jgi:putative transposase